MTDCSGLKTPYGTKPIISLTRVDSQAKSDGLKLGTYGVIKGESAFLVAQCDSDDKSIVDTGFVIEHIILGLCDMGIGSCWLGGTFKRKNFLDLEGLHEDLIIPAVVPIGFPKERTRFVDGMMRRMAGSDKRKEWEELFFDNDLNTPLMRASAGMWVDALDMVRFAPSASNKQPWRISLDHEAQKAHLFLQRTPRYAGNQFGFNMQMLDMGIALCHLVLTLESQNHTVVLEFDQPDIEIPDDYYSYISTIVIK